MRTLRHALVLARKDLLIERRTRRVMSVVGVMGVLVVAVLALGLGPAARGGIGGASVGGVGGVGGVAILWTAYLFSAVLCFERTMALERRDQAMAGLLLTPSDRGAIFLGKLLTNLALVGVMAAVVTPVGVVLFGLDLSPAPVGFAAIMALSLVGVAALGTLFSAVVSGQRGGESGLLGLVLLPLCLPLVLVSTQTVMATFAAGGMPERTVPLLVSFDVLFVAMGWAGFVLLCE